jgi:thioredoxin-like negative regulator of GroEL
MNLQAEIDLLKQTSDLEPSNIEIKLKLADLYFKTNQLPLALNQYILILELEPTNESYQIQYQTIKDIVSLGQLDIYASPNTHLDPWL